LSEKIFHPQDVEIGDEVGSVVVLCASLFAPSQPLSLQLFFGYVLLDLCDGFSKGLLLLLSRAAFGHGTSSKEILRFTECLSTLLPLERADVGARYSHSKEAIVRGTLMGSAGWGENGGW
jgi:hypothetical protein